MKIKFISILILFSSLLSAQECVLVHGWLSDGTVWNGTGVKNVIQNEFLFQNIFQPTINGTASVEDQSLNLRNYLITNNINNALAISYSMGGMSTRYHLKRQYTLGQASRINWHFTIGTPHKGTPIANNVDAAVRRILITAEAVLYPGWLAEDINGISFLNIPGWSEYYSALVIIFGDFLYQLVFPELGGPALADLAEDSPADIYINHSGTAYENDIAKVGITGTEDFPEVYRLGSSFFSGISEDDMLGYVEDVKDFKALLIIMDLLNYIDEPNNPEYIENLEQSTSAYAIICQFPYAWNALATYNFNGHSDGLVKKENQNYPNHDHQFYAYHCNHGEELSNNDVKEKLKMGLNIYNFPSQTPPVIDHLSQSPIFQYVRV
jgi:hypothetical protein